MATVNDLYTQEGAALSKMHGTVTAHRTIGNVDVQVSTLWHDELGAFYRAYYLDAAPEVGIVDVMNSLVGAPRHHEGLQIIGSHPAQFGQTTNANLSESRYTIIYVNGMLRDEDAAIVQSHYTALGKTVIIRDQRFADYVTMHSQPAAFISHDSRDKAEFARPLADRLGAQLVPVWYDEYSLKVGDNIYESIEKGLKLAPKVIVLLSKNFFANASWARHEFLMAVHRHIAEKVLLPVWIDVDAEEVRRYDLTLAGLMAVRWPSGVDRVQAASAVAQELADVIKAPRS